MGLLSGNEILCSLLGIQSDLRDPEKRGGENLDCYLTTTDTRLEQCVKR